jgi:hypothetical protein
MQFKLMPSSQPIYKNNLMMHLTLLKLKNAGLNVQLLRQTQLFVLLLVVLVQM